MGVGEGRRRRGTRGTREWNERSLSDTDAATSGPSYVSAGNAKPLLVGMGVWLATPITVIQRSRTPTVTHAPASCSLAVLL